MSVVVVTIATQPTSVSPVAPTNAASSSGTAGLSSWTVAGIIIGSLLGAVLFIALVLYFLHRRRKQKHAFTKVPNPTHVPSTSSRRNKPFARHTQRPSVSTEPLMSPAPWQSHASTSQAPSQIASAIPLRSETLSPGIRDSQYSFYEADLAEIGQVVAAGTITTPAILDIPARKPESATLRPSRSGSDIEAADGSPSTPKQTPFLHRIIQSRAQASEAVAVSPTYSLNDQRMTTDSMGSLVDVDALLADAERRALRDAEANQRGVNQGEGEEGEEEQDDDTETAESVYSQLSASMDHATYFPESGSRSLKGILRKNSSRRRGRTPAVPTELPPVAEVPDTPRSSERFSSRPVSTAVNSSLDAHGSHSSRSRTSSAANQPGVQLLTSTDFGQDGSTSGGSISSTVGRGSNSNSSGRASRYPSLAFSGAGQSSGSGSRSEGETDWHHLPSGLAALTSLEIGTLHNPHSPVEPPSQTDVSRSPSDATYAPPATDKRAHLREGRVSSMPEVERRAVVQGGIASIDVAL